MLKAEHIPFDLCTLQSLWAVGGVSQIFGHSMEGWMRTGLRLALGSLSLLILSVGAVAPSADAAANERPLSHARRWITDASGRVIVLHGTSMVYKLPPYTPGAAGFGADDAAFLKSIGFNSVRVGIIWKALEPEPGVYDERYIDQIRNTVETLAKQGIYSQLDFHQDLVNERFQGEGFPDWAVQDDGLLAQPQRGFPANYYSMPALQHALENFWANAPGPGGIGLQDRFAEAWRHVAQHFARNPAVLGYEIFNEPFPGKAYIQCYSAAGCPDFDAELTAFYRRVDSAIRTVDSKTLVWYEPNVLFNFGAPTHVAPLGDSRAGFAFHDYCLENEAHGCATQGTTLANADQFAAESGDALMLTEFGATDSALDLNGMVSLADQHMVSWQEWAYCGCLDPTGAAAVEGIVRDPHRPPTGSNLVKESLKALVEPYPQAVAGTPSSWAFDRARRTFALSYSTLSAASHRSFAVGSLSEIAMPSLNYPHGYRVRVSGGAVVSAPNAAVLTVASCRQGGGVKVTAGPAIAAKQSCRPQLRLEVRPRVARVGLRTKYRFQVQARLGSYLGPVAGAKVEIGGRSATTNGHGVATLVVSMGKRLTQDNAVATAPGYKSTQVRLTSRG